jgi:hypothetical protein
MVVLEKTAGDPPGLRTAAFIAWTTFIRRRWASDGEKLLERSIKTVPMSISMILNPHGKYMEISHMDPYGPYHIPFAFLENLH